MKDLNKTKFYDNNGHSLSDRASTGTDNPYFDYNLPNQENKKEMMKILEN